MKRPWLRQLLIAASLLGYAILAHYSNAAGASRLGVAVGLVPPLLAVFLLLRRRRGSWLLLMLAGLAVAGLLLRYWQLLENNYALIFLLQDCGVYVLLAAAFGRSLTGAQVPVCTYWADRLHGPLSPAAQRYTRRATAAWTVFFVCIALTNLLLFAFAPLRVWSLFTNFLTLPLAVLMFLAEYTLRRVLLPSMNRFTLRDTLRAYVAQRTDSSPRA